MTKEELYLEFEKITMKIFELDVNDANVVSKVQEYVDEREAIIDQLKLLEGDVSNNVLNRVMQKNIQAETKLEEIMFNIKNKLSSVVNEKSLSSKKKKAHRGYMNLGHQNDGYFIDNKK